MKNIFDYSHVKSVSAIALIDMKTNKPVGKIVANWSDNPAGSVCTAQVIIHDGDKYGIISKKRKVDLMGKLTELSRIWIGKAGGGGYDKLSAAICNALYENTFAKDNPELPKLDFDGAGISSAQIWFEKLGITFFQVV